ncbi:DUF192 domain-containing protein [Altererythrobacter marinus]|uniref:DUF192 domain-containing protein n=1 Tax=Pelagerythrobacter marinus TaxID=538382 RepID=A0ABW9UYX1_9SPHN|nr:DUF192 domain-containing protein [Pelagerythrobacter marinus]MXO69678.1 DUF192 domain-containing protein [Pelagerythrobacter marinus]
MRRTTAVIFLALAAACSPQAGAGGAAAATAAPGERHEVLRHPVSGLEIVELEVATGTGRHRFAVEVARTPRDQAQGLMFRTQLGENEGMLFPRDPPDIASFWMKNTPLPLDIIFIGPDGRIINIAAETVPYSLDPVVAAGPTAAVLELRGGRAAELGIGPGDRVEWPVHGAARAR